MGRVNDNNYYVVQAWMVTKLKLKGLEKDIFAIVYGYTQHGNGTFNGSLEYLAQMTGCTRNGACNTLQKLVDKQFILKEYIIKNHVKQCSYTVNEEIINTKDRPTKLDARPTKLDALDEETAERRPTKLDVNIINNKNIKNKKDKKDVRQKTPLFETSSKDLYEVFLDMFYDNCPSFGKITKLTTTRKRSITKLFKNYDKQTILKVLKKCEKSQFLLDNRKKWAKLDWIIKEDNFVKILEGNYDSSYTNTKDKQFEMGNVKTQVATEEEKEEARRVVARLKKEGKQYEF